MQDAIDKGKGSTSQIEQYKLVEIQEDSAIVQKINLLVKEILEPKDQKRASLEKRRAKANHAKAKSKKTSIDEPKIVEQLKNQLSSASKEINELKRALAKSYSANVEAHQKKLLQQAVNEIKKYKEKAETLEKENKALREVIAKNLAKSLPQSKEMVFYGGQYSNPET